MDEKSRLLGKLTDEYVQKLFTSRLYTPILVTVSGKCGDVKCTDDELYDRLKYRLDHEFDGTDYTFLKNVVYDRMEMYRENRQFKFFGDLPKERARFNVIWLNGDKSLEVRKRELERYLDCLAESSNSKPQKKRIELPGVAFMTEVDMEPNLARFDISDRCLGRSTRQADEYVQKFLDLKPGEYVEITDHYECGNVGMANKMLCDKVCGRLKYEYGVKFYLQNGNVPRIVKIQEETTSQS